MCPLYVNIGIDSSIFVGILPWIKCQQRQKDIPAIDDLSISGKRTNSCTTEKQWFQSLETDLAESQLVPCAEPNSTIKTFGSCQKC